MDFEKLIGQSTGPRRIEYTWRDVALYALAVGAGEDELDYYYERHMKTLPSFGVIPCRNAGNNFPQRPAPRPAPMLVMDVKSSASFIDNSHRGSPPLLITKRTAEAHVVH